MISTRWEGSPDEQLMEATALGEEAAFEVLSLRLYPSLVRYCSKLTGRQDDADDLAQETLLKLWGARARYLPTAPLKAFVLTIARNLCLQSLRGAGRRALRVVPSEDGSTPELATSGPQALERLVAAERGEALKAALQQLPELQREALLLRFDQGLDYAAAAQVLGRGESTIRSQVFYGLKKLRELLAAKETR